MKFDAIIVGGGFYGVSIALYLRVNRGLSRILVVEKESDLISRASEINQARVHNGYHYPRNLLTGRRSNLNSKKFIEAYSSAIYSDFQSVYAIARRMSFVNGCQFTKFCDSVGAPYKYAPQSVRKLFSQEMVEDVYLVDEKAFDYELMRNQIWRALRENGIEVWLGATTTNVSIFDKKLIVSNQLKSDDVQIEARYVFNCTYSGLNKINGAPRSNAAIKHEVTEMCVVKPPSILSDLGITIMDGPFFSLVPYPAMKAHTLSHVRYTPHCEFSDDEEINPYDVINTLRLKSNYKKMLRDAYRFVPKISESIYVESLYEIKTVLRKNEVNDGRPILFEKSKDVPGLYFVLGGKIDNIYDIFERLEMEYFGE